jgi:hypothetical protein
MKRSTIILVGAIGTALILIIAFVIFVSTVV